MKYLICLALVIFASVSHSAPTLKLSTQANLFRTGQNVRPQVGLMLHAPLVKGASFSLYTGLGINPFDESSTATWYTTKAQLNYNWRKWTFSPGMSYCHNSIDEGRNDFAFVRVDYQIF